MIYINATNESIDALVKSVCALLYATDQFLLKGHNESTTSATVTFVKFKLRVYSVTCHHVLSAFFAAAVDKQCRLVPAIHSGHAIHQFGSIGYEGKLKWAFQSCREFPDCTDIGDSKALDALDRKTQIRQTLNRRFD